MNLYEKIKTKNSKIGVISLGYVAFLLPWKRPRRASVSWASTSRNRIYSSFWDLTEKATDV